MSENQTNLQQTEQVVVKKEKKESKIMEILRTEYSFENWILAILAPFIALIGVYILDGSVVTISKTDWWIFNAEWKIKVIAWFLVVIGISVIAYLLIPHFKPSYVEMKKVSWLGVKKTVNHCLRVFGFVIVFGDRYGAGIDIQNTTIGKLPGRDMGMPVKQDITRLHRRQLFQVMVVAVGGVDQPVTDRENAVVRQDGKLQYHLIYF